jgi:hypothetical protein
MTPGNPGPVRARRGFTSVGRWPTVLVPVAVLVPVTVLAWHPN